MNPLAFSCMLILGIALIFIAGYHVPLFGKWIAQSYRHAIKTYQWFKLERGKNLYDRWHEWAVHVLRDRLYVGEPLAQDQTGCVFDQTSILTNGSWLFNSPTVPGVPLPPIMTIGELLGKPLAQDQTPSLPAVQEVKASKEPTKEVEELPFTSVYLLWDYWNNLSVYIQLTDRGLQIARIEKVEGRYGWMVAKSASAVSLWNKHRDLLTRIVTALTRNVNERSCKVHDLLGGNDTVIYSAAQLLREETDDFPLSDISLRVEDYPSGHRRYIVSDISLLNGSAFAHIKNSRDPGSLQPDGVYSWTLTNHPLQEKHAHALALIARVLTDKINDSKEGLLAGSYSVDKLLSGLNKTLSLSPEIINDDTDLVYDGNTLYAHYIKAPSSHVAVQALQQRQVSQIAWRDEKHGIIRGDILMLPVKDGKVITSKADEQCEGSANLKSSRPTLDEILTEIEKKKPLGENVPPATQGMMEEVAR